MFGVVILCIAVIVIIYFIISKRSDDNKKSLDGYSKEEQEEIKKILRFTGKRRFKDVTQDEMQKYIIRSVAEDFHKPGWDVWDDSIHYANGQSDRMERAFHSERHLFSIIDYDKNTMKATIKGKSGVYTTGPDGCTCMDFMRRHLPCKHMYYLAAETNE